MSVDDVIARKAALSDTTVITSLLIELGCNVEEAEVRRRMAPLLVSEADRVFVAELDGRIVGLISIHVAPLLHRDALGRITAFIVTQDLRGQGIGMKLLAEAEKWAIEKGCSQVELNSGDHHQPAHAFYKNRGYRTDDRRFLKEDEALNNS